MVRKEIRAKTRKYCAYKPPCISVIVIHGRRSFMMVNARRSAGKDRVIFWFNVRQSSLLELEAVILKRPISSGRTRLFIL